MSTPDLERIQNKDDFRRNISLGEVVALQYRDGNYYIDTVLDDSDVMTTLTIKFPRNSKLRAKVIRIDKRFLEHKYTMVKQVT